MASTGTLAARDDSGGKPFPASARASAVQARAEEDLRITIGTCTLGVVLIAVAEAGIVAILLGDDAEALRVDLARRFPRSRVETSSVSARRGGDWDRVIAVLDGRDAGDRALRLDPRGTSFQRQVWAALRDIPSGETTTYGEIARRVGRPQAVRAVAGACAANPIAVVIPCHRVVRADGLLSGYRWGIARKRMLLARERPTNAPISGTV